MRPTLRAVFGASIVALSFVALWRCASQTRIAPEVRAQIEKRHAGNVVELRQSNYYGELYDENELWLLSPHPFADTSHIVDMNGAPIHPRGQKGIVPAGSRFVIERIEFPDRGALTHRMLTTPRYNPWVYLKPAPDETHAPLENRRGFVALLPLELETEQQVEDALAAMFAPEGDVQRWLGTRRPTVRAAIEHKNVVEGMSREELTAAWGAPAMWFIEQSDKGEARVAWYTSKEVWLVNDTVSEVKQGRAVQEAPRENVSSEGTPTTPPPQS